MIIYAAIAIFIVAAAFINIKLPSGNSTLSLPDLGKAPELADIKGWINSNPLTLSSLHGKVVLIDFWTYSCVNCIRTLPYLTTWYAKYSNAGLVIIGVHSPEFEFEKSYDNVNAAVEKYGIKYPVALDNNHGTWNAFSNNYWPREFLIDARGEIRYDHIGEGNYDETERAIQQLLKEINPGFSSSISNITSGTDFSKISTPEIYLGYLLARQPLGNSEGFSADNTVDYKNTTVDRNNVVYLYGEWRDEADRITAVNNSKITLIYTAKEVEMVAGGNSTAVVYLDGRPLASNYLGQDTTLVNGRSSANISNYRMYNIVSAPDYGTHLLEVYPSTGFEIYTFTFG